MVVLRSRGGGGGEGEGDGADVISNDPHLTGGEQTVCICGVCPSISVGCNVFSVSSTV